MGGMYLRGKIFGQSLRMKLLAFFLFLSLVPFGVASLIVLRTVRHEAELSVTQEMSSLATATGRTISLFMQGLVANQLVLADVTVLREAVAFSGFRNEATHMLKTMVEHSPCLQAVMVLDKNGICVLATSDSITGSDHSQSASFQNGQKALFIESLHQDPAIARMAPDSGGWTVSITVPIKKWGETIGVLTSFVKWSTIEKILSQAGLGQTGYMLMVDTNGAVICHPSREFYNQPLSGAKVAFAEVEAAIRKRKRSAAFSARNPRTGRRGHQIVGIAFPEWSGNLVDLDWKLVAGADPMEMMAFLPTIVGNLTIVGAGIAILVIAFAFMAADIIVEPIKDMAVRVSKVTDGESTVDFSSVKAYEELLPLVDAIQTYRSMVEQRTKELVHINEQLTQEMRDRQSAEESQRNSERRYRSLFKESKDAIVICLPEGVIVDANPAFVELTGFAREQILGTNVLQFYKNPEDRVRFVEELERIGFVKEFPLLVKREDGAERSCRLTSSVWKDEQAGVRAYFTIVRDITESTRLQEQLAQSQKMESVGRLAGGVAHDFNNMLTAILGHAELALMRSEPSDRTRADLQVIIETGRRSAGLVRQLLAFARKQTAAPKVLDLNATTTNTLKMLQRLLGEDVELVWKPGKDLWPVKIDPSQVDQLLVNLCVNARDAIQGAGKVTIETGNRSFNEAYCAMHSEFIPGDYVMLAVSDDGCGMSKEVTDRLFEPFFTTKELGKGTGLGLATAYGIVKQNSGFISVYSEPGEGSIFKVCLPRLDQEAVKPAHAKATETPKGSGETMLLVEDEEAILEVCQTMLEGLGYRVLSARKPSEALRLAQSHSGKIHLLITDVVMPEMNGRELAETIRNFDPELKCLFSSGYTANVIAHHGVLDEGVHFLQKPYSLRNLAMKVQEALEQK